MGKVNETKGIPINSHINMAFSCMAFFRNKEDKEVRRPEHGKLAVLTGVISRSTIGMPMILSLSWEASEGQPWS